MPSTDAALRAELGNALRSLESALAEFARHARRETHDLWCWPGPSAGGELVALADLSRHESLQRLIGGIQNVEYVDGQDPHASSITPGVLVLGAEGLALAADLNRAKSSLASVLSRMQGRTAQKHNPRSLDMETRPLREIALEGFGWRRLHHFQATRELVVLARMPDYIGFTWAQLREIRRTLREDLLEELSGPRRDPQSPLVAADLAALKRLPGGEPLALIRPARLTPRINVAWEGKSAQEETRSSHVAVLPIVLRGERLPARFRKLPPAPPPANYRLTRSDTQIESKPFLQTLPAHRYLPEFRERKAQLIRSRARTRTD